MEVKENETVFLLVFFHKNIRDLLAFLPVEAKMGF